MRSNVSFLVVATFAMSSAFASAQASRTWVSGVGDDVNPCSRTAPCKTFAGAISKTAAGGEIDALDPGGFGTVTITKSIVIDGGGQIGSILGSSTNGVNINAGAGDTVTLRNLTINGAGTGTNGVNVTSVGSFALENVTITGFATGVNIAPAATAKAMLSRATTSGNSTAGLVAGGAGSSGLVKVTATDSVFSGTTAGSGVVAGSNSNVTIRNSVSSNNSGSGFAVTATGAAAQLTLVNSTASSNGGPGLSVSGTASASAVARIVGSTILFNTGGISIGTGGFVGSYGDNELTGGIAGGTLTVLPKQ
ncbi:hypothetical protein Terro_4032 [Terriglobus roseus DSM 18391]|uniref:Right handed beta helix domain-containing protein n=1 Tax=Terriglobus roseus (strain DSM 18391 / NRRL B-41598 / KBS 63) TaxID=926566 RepID=I3ZLX2_TERRK|nr:hypothetical protein Terro_4032 [Terriglobus roseus DSM 18391]